MIGGETRSHFTPPPIRAKSRHRISSTPSLRLRAAMVPAFPACKPLETIRPVLLDSPNGCDLESMGHLDGTPAVELPVPPLLQPLDREPGRPMRARSGFTQDYLARVGHGTLDRPIGATWLSVRVIIVGGADVRDDTRSDWSVIASQTSCRRTATCGVLPPPASLIAPDLDDRDVDVIVDDEALILLPADHEHDAASVRDDAGGTVLDLRGVRGSAWSSWRRA
jgi:hypothetical protein